MLKKDALSEANSNVVAGYCDAFWDYDFTLRHDLIHMIYSGLDCVQSVSTLEYNSSQSAIYDPLSEELSTSAICAEFNEMIALLNSVGLTSEIDGLRFSYEVSFTEDTTA
jgi:hypothetical protein